MPHVLGKMTAVLHPDGRREVSVSNIRIDPNDKPRTLAASGSDLAVWAKLRAGESGTYETIAHFGGATALLVSRGAIALPDPEFLGQMAENFGGLGEEALLGAVRTGASAATQFCVDTVGGMFTTLDWDFETLGAALKILPFRDDSWVRILLPSSLAQFQSKFDEAQRRRWAVARSGFRQKHEARITFVPTGRDSFNGEPTLVVFGPIGDCQFIRVARLELEGGNFRFCDGEWRESVGNFTPLHRQIVATTTVENYPGVPLILQLHPDGHLHPGGLHVFAEGPNRRLYSHNPARVLGPHGLGWLKP